MPRHDHGHPADGADGGAAGGADGGAAWADGAGRADVAGEGVGPADAAGDAGAAGPEAPSSGGEDARGGGDGGGGGSLASALLGWSQPRTEGGPALEDGTRAIALVALLLMVPALYVDMPTYVALLAERSVVLPLIPVAASGVVSVLLGTLLFLIGAYASDVAAPLETITRRRFYSIAVMAMGLGLLLVGILFPRTIWELCLLMLYCLPGILGVYAVALGSARLAYLLFVLVASAVFVDRAFPSGWVGPAVLAASLIVFLECLDAHSRLTRAMHSEVNLQRGLAGGGAPEDVVRSNYVVIQRRFHVVLGRTVAVASAVSIAAVSSVGLAAWATGGALPHSMEAKTMSGLAIPVMVVLAGVLAFNMHKSGLRDAFTVGGGPVGPPTEPMGPPVGILGEEGPGEPRLTRLQRLRRAPRSFISRVAALRRRRAGRGARRGARRGDQRLPWDGPRSG